MTRYLLQTLTLCGLLLASGMAWAQSYVIEDIEIEGLERITAGTTLTYLPVQVGDTFDDARSPEVIRALFQTGFFSDVEVARRGDVLVVIVQERPAINEIRFSGNRDIPTDALTDALQGVGLQRGRVFNRTILDRIENELRQQYLARGRYNVQIDIEITELPRNRVDVDITIAEGQVARIREVNIVGNEAFDDRSLTRRFESGVPRWWAFLSRRDHYSRQKLSGDLEKLRSHYLDEGFLNFDVDSTQVTLTPDRKDIYITINVDEGAQYRIGAVDLAGDLILPAEELRELIEVQPGEVFSRREVVESAERISRRLTTEGFAFANVNPVPEVDEETREVALTFFVDPGPRVYVRRITITGNSRTLESVYRRELRQMEGAWFNGDQIDRSRVRVQRLPFVESVNIETRRVAGSEDEVDLEIAVTERMSGALSLGAGYSQNQGLLLTGSLSQDNFLGSGNRVTISLSRSDVSQMVNFSVLNPHYTIHGASRGFSVFYQEIDAEEANISRFAANRFGGDVTYGIPLSEFGTLTIQPGFENVEIVTVADTPGEILDFIDREGNQYNLLSTEVSYTYDTRDSVIFAASGRRHRVGAELVLPGSDLQYYRLSYSGQEIFKLSDSYSLSLSARLGYGDGYGSTDELPFFEHYFAGGIRTVRGFKDNSLGPRDSNDDPYGGSFRTTGSVELFFPLPFAADNDAVRMSSFVDAGQVFASVDDFEADELRVSAGLAMTWMSPVGPLSLSYGVPLREKDGDETQSVQFLLGAAF
ncbi:outer membrane protein assembly factor BamA [Thioalkalivibrio paradoxus]|uniref:Outer membrane protein assembly factor BamA n=1 Tax=Thioalkalivibrio paradoxus ARh 1 TaxID=713585 RepID=W0DNY4_9GAMM|nr:outer membrane protein assembly factor BamA [Thioalkalivibrio paradoxus]AHE98595.1 polymerase [Thioalkalivibrio paradoxus ARh 1]